MNGGGGDVLLLKAAPTRRVLQLLVEQSFSSRQCGGRHIGSRLIFGHDRMAVRCKDVFRHQESGQMRLVVTRLRI